MIKYLFDPPNVIKKIFSVYYWNSYSDKILITFDDGPNPETTETILKILNNKNLQAIFFCVGSNANKYPNLIQEIIASGHVVGNHTYNHKIFTQNNLSLMRNEIESTNRLFLEKFNYTTMYFRPPHGRFNRNLQAILDDNKLKNVMWSLLTYDYKSDIKIVKFALKKYLRNNSIIVFHDSLKSKNIIEQSLNITIDIVESKNYKLGKVNECLS